MQERPFTLREYLNWAESRSLGSATQPLVSDWLDFCPFVLRGSSFLVVDPSFVPSESDGVVLKATSGNYLLKAKVASYGQDHRIARLRVIQESAQPSLGEQVGETWSDTAMTSVCDLEAVKQVWGEDDDASFEKVSRYFDEAGDYGIALLGGRSDPTIPFVSSGFGDGVFPVYELLEGGKVVGFEIVFIADAASYPFQKDSEMGAAIPGLAQGTGKSSLLETVQDLQKQYRAEADQMAAEFRSRLGNLRRNAAPPRMRLIPSLDRAWFLITPAKELVEFVRGEGFTNAGLFTLNGNSRVLVAGFVDPGRTVHGSVLRLGEKAFLSFVVRGMDGSILEVNPMPVPFEPPCPAWLRRYRMPDATPAELWAKLCCEAATMAAREAGEQDFGESAELDYQKYQTWLAERGGMTRGELAVQLKTSGQLPTGAEGEALLDMARDDEAEKALWNWLTSRRGLSFAPEGEVERILAIHDDKSTDLLLNAYWCSTGDFEASASDLAGDHPRAQFAALVAKRGNRLRLGLQKGQPFPVDFYLPVS
jgi:hypothetical protein